MDSASFENEKDVKVEELVNEPRFTDEQERRVVRKFDTRLLPFLSFMYLFSSLDRSSVGNAVLDNFEQDLGMTGNQLNIAVTIFYVGFLAFQIPSNIMLKRYGAKVWLPLLMAIWGTIACCHAAAKNWAQLMVLRVLLGFFESGFFAGVVYYLTTFYKKHEMATRIAVFWGSTTAAHAFAGVLAFGILQMRGIGGLAGWQWLFLIEGIPTVLISAVAFFYLPDGPAKCRWLTEEEKQLAEQRISSEGPGGHQILADINPSNRTEAFEAFKDWKVWMYMIIFFCGSVPNTSVSNFLPSIVKGMGYNDRLDANLMSAPPYVCAVVVVILIAYSSDRFHDRAYHAIGGAAVCLLGYILLLSVSGNSARYGAVCLAVAGVFVINPVVNAWLTGNIAPSMKKSVATAMAVMANNSAGLVGSNIYLSTDAPNYTKGHAINLGFTALFIILVCVLRFLLWRENKTRQQKLEEIEAGKVAEAQGRIGDRRLDFRYAL
ncbi:major facilitator superfamily domain-containing protein [Umbelopsis sp. PMI_123]|nr:major facilitator superfamily domain-containing protein [Umbelopsis sp. PMI_123]